MSGISSLLPPLHALPVDLTFVLHVQCRTGICLQNAAGLAHHLAHPGCGNVPEW